MELNLIIRLRLRMGWAQKREEIRDGIGNSSEGNI